jgi:hypothetical protein
MQFTDHYDATILLMLQISTLALAFNAFHSQSHKSAFACTLENQLQFRILASIKSLVRYYTLPALVKQINSYFLEFDL